MNILPQKSWHVRTKKNIEKVRKDEAKAAEEQKEKDKRLEIAESEARVNILRARSGASTSTTTAAAAVGGRTSTNFTLDDQFLNLFQQEKEGKFNEDKNAEVEAEKRVEVEKYEKKIGLLRYLNDDSIDSIKNKPWCHTVGPTKRSASAAVTIADTSNEVDLKMKNLLDPVNIMKSHFKNASDDADDADKGSKKKKKAKKSEKESKEKQQDKTTNIPVKKSKTIEEMRAERLKREMEERLKAERLLKPVAVAQKPVELDERKRKYNSQYNPDSSRF